MASSLRTCRDCGDEFYGRADADYCSTACRQRAYRKRNATVKRNETDSGNATVPVPVGNAWMAGRFGGAHTQMSDNYLNAEQAAAVIAVQRLRKGSIARRWLEDFIDPPPNYMRDFIFLERYVGDVATIGVWVEEVDDDRDLRTPLGEALPESVNPSDAAEMAHTLELAIVRQQELLNLLRRRAREG